MFPFNATPTGKPRSTELMSRSLAPQYDGLSYGLIRSQIFGDYNRSFVNDMSRSLAICNLKDNNHTNPMPTTAATTTTLPTVEEVLYEETPPPSTPPQSSRTFSPADNIISPQVSHRAPSPKRSTSGTQFSNHTLPFSTSTTDGVGQQIVASPTSSTGRQISSQSNHNAHKQTNGTSSKENGARSSGDTTQGTSK